jgi:hypothetical protein
MKRSTFFDPALDFMVVREGLEPFTSALHHAEPRSGRARQVPTELRTTYILL